MYSSVNINGENVDTASCRVTVKRQGCLFCLAVCILLILCPAVYGEEISAPAIVKTQSDCDRAAILDLRVVYEDEELSGLVTPPAGVYPFEPGDGVVLRAYGTGEIPVAIDWSGDISGHGETQYVDMDGHKRITATFRRTDKWPENKSSPWFDVTENKNFYAFLGGGDLYGWFVASRNEKKGAGITHLTHRKAFLNPVFHITSLNFEHIISGAYADNYRSVFTPRTDPMRFCVESPGMVRIRWPREGASWDMESEMTYRFDGKDAIDIEFSTIPGEEKFPQGYAAFMWATYQSNFKEHVIYFPGVSGEKSGWTHYGPTIAEDRFGGTIAFEGSTALPLENGASAFNVIESEQVFFTQPYYYGLLDISVPKSNQQVDLIYAMLFDQDAPIRFAVWNWGDPPETSAWDWQYVLHNPEPEKRACYHARMICAELEVPDDVTACYDAWRETLVDANTNTSEVIAYPEMPVYWSPASILFDPLVVGECMERHNPDHALALYREALIALDDAPRIASKLDDLLSHEYGNERRVEEWLYILERRKKWVGEAMPVLLLAHAYHDKGDLAAAIETLRQGVLEQPTNAEQLFFYGELLLEVGETASGIENLALAIQQDEEKASPAGELVAGYAEQTVEKKDMAQAEHLYRMAAELAPDDHWHKVHLGELLEEQGRGAEAEAIYRSVLLVAPESPYTARLVDSLYHDRNDVAGQIRFWQDVHEQTPNAAVPALHLGKAYYERQDYENTATVLEVALASASDNQEIRFYLGAAKLWLGQDDAGIPLIKTAAQAMPILAEPGATVFVNRAATLMESGDYAAAAKYYREAITLAPDDVWYAVYLGEALAKQGKGEESLALFIQGMNTIPESPYIAELIHTHFIQNKDVNGSIRIWQDIIENHPDAVLPKIQLVRACFEGREYARAMQLAGQLQGVDDPELTFYRCAAQLYLQNLEQGRIGLQTLAQQNAAYAPRAADVVAERAQKAFDEKEFVLAEQLYRDALALAPEDLMHAVHLAGILEQLDNNEEALHLYVQVLTHIQDAPKTAALLDALLVRVYDSERRIAVWTDVHNQNPEAALPLLYLEKARETKGNSDLAVKTNKESGT